MEGLEGVRHRTVQTNGIKMHIAEQGEGPVVLLLHGFPDLWYSWRHQIPTLASAGYHVVAPDLRGYGDSDAPASPNQYTVFHITGDLIGLLDALAVSKAFVVGHDFGSYMASYLCLFRPDRVHALINLSAPFTPRDPTRKPTDKLKSAFGEEYYICRYQEPGKAEADFAKYDSITIAKKTLTVHEDLFAAPLDKGILDVLEVPESLPTWISEEEIQYYAKQYEKTGYTGGLNYYRALDLTWELMAPWAGSQITVPAKFIVGDKDLVYTAPGTKNYIHGGGFKKTVPLLNEVVIIEGAYHFVHQERPNEVSEHILKFLGKFSAL
eukprot:TRINITY_DN25715_c0_g1_i1.p1 TRINITY_DN25715_c0_g1~~TRINITY_DN25715_c0_g1_i1.p1  ORF type:complete len:323 (+),score=50.39 TRINITY_DN25715_c0_g1_i1:141-1109(+)